MIKGIGIDLIELRRIEEGLDKNARLMERILTQSEQTLFQQLTTKKRRVEFLAGRFAAKEAFAKAAGVGIGKLSFQHIEILPNAKGAPKITAQGYEKYHAFLSITHSEAYAAAQVVLEYKNLN